MRKLVLITTGLAALSACDLSGDWLFPDAVEGYPAVIDLGEITPLESGWVEEADADGVDNDGDGEIDDNDEQDYVDALAKDTIQQNFRYGFIGANSGGEKAGATFTFEGTGGDVCLMVDPELVFWNQSVSGGGNAKYKQPDNVFDDGDIDMLAGFSVYYTGTPGESLGDFYIRYEDSLGNEIPVEFNECTQASLNATTGGFGGRGSPEYCTLSATQPGLSYTGVLEVWSTPLDDDVVSFGLAVVQMSCSDMINTIFDEEPECVIKGESLDINDFAPESGQTFTAEVEVDTGTDSTYVYVDGKEPVANAFGVSSVELEEAFCDGRRAPLPDLCEQEQFDLEAVEGGPTWYEFCVEQGNRCFCGDLTDTPEGGSF